MPSSKSPHLFRKIKKFADEIAALGGKPLYKLTPEEARELLLSIQRKSYKEIEANIEDTNIFTGDAGNVDVRIIRPAGSEGEKLPVIVYLHGGGWVIGDKETHDMLVRKLSNCTNSAVVFPNYELSPEARYPKAIEQSYAVLEYIFAHPDEFNFNADKIVIAGDSAGGNMAAAIAIKAKKENGPNIIYQALLYPVTDAAMDTKSYDKFKDGPWLTKKAMEWFWDAYCPEKFRRKETLASPLCADIEELTGLPPALIITDENDVLRDEGEAYARKLDEAGVETINIRINGTQHDFLMLNELIETNPSKGAFAILCNLLKKVLHS